MKPYQPLTSFYANAHIEWICANNLTPYIQVNCNVEDVIVPEHLVKDGVIVFNVSPAAVLNFKLNENAMSFSAKFGGVPQGIYCPLESLEIIFAKEDPHGSMFPIGDMTFNDNKDKIVLPKEKPDLDKVDIRMPSTLNIVEVEGTTSEIKPTKSRAHLTLVKT